MAQNLELLNLFDRSMLPYVVTRRNFEKFYTISCPELEDMIARKSTSFTENSMYVETSFDFRRLLEKYRNRRPTLKWATHIDSDPGDCQIVEINFSYEISDDHYLAINIFSTPLEPGKKISDMLGLKNGHFYFQYSNNVLDDYLS